jgi:hypothetical protein
VLSPRGQALLADLASMVESELRAVQMATIDELTAINNCRGFMLLAKKIEICIPCKNTCRFAFLDLNHHQDN